MNRKLALSVPFVLLAILIYSMMWGVGDEQTDSLAGAVVKRGDLRISELSRGNLEAKDSARLVNELEGRANIIYLIEEGTRVEAGDVVCELDTSGHEDRLVDQAISVDRARSSLVKAQEQYEIQVIQNASDEAEAVLSMELAQLKLEAYIADEGEWDGELARANEAIVLAEERIKQAEETLAWTTKLYEKGFVQKTELDRDQLNVTSAGISHDQAVRDRNLKKSYGDRAKRKELQASVESRQRDLEVVKKQAAARLVDFDAARRTAERELERQEEKHDKLKDQISKGVLRAPEAGLVVYARTRSRHGQDQVPQEGAEVYERQAIVTIPRAGGMVADVSLHETKLDKVRVGLACLIKIDALRGEVFHGQVASVAAVADSGSWMSNPNQRLYATEVALTQEVADMRPGMSCSIEILVDDLQDVLYVPVQSVFLDAGLPICFVREGGSIEQRSIEVGHDNNKWAHVVSGLAEGETVLLSPPPSWEPQAPPEEDAPEDLPELESGDVSEKPEAATGPPASGGLSEEQRQAMRERFQNMSEEEQAAARKRFRSGGGRPGGGADHGAGAGSNQ